VKIRHRDTRIIRTTELARLFAESANIDPTPAWKLLRTFIACISVALQYGHTVSVAGLGKFEPMAYRGGRRKGGEILTGEHYRVKFTPNTGLLRQMKAAERGRRAKNNARNPGESYEPEALQADRLGE